MWTINSLGWSDCKCASWRRVEVIQLSCWLNACYGTWWRILWLHLKIIVWKIRWLINFSSIFELERWNQHHERTVLIEWDIGIVNRHITMTKLIHVLSCRSWSTPILLASYYIRVSSWIIGIVYFLSDVHYFWCRNLLISGFLYELKPDRGLT